AARSQGASQNAGGQEDSADPSATKAESPADTDTSGQNSPLAKESTGATRTQSGGAGGGGMGTSRSATSPEAELERAVESIRQASRSRLADSDTNGAEGALGDVKDW